MNLDISNSGLGAKGPRYIAIAGNIGVGKSSLVRFLCDEYGVDPFYEPNSLNPFLTDFYSDMKRWSFHSQVSFLAEKFRLHQQLEVARQKKTVIQDRSIYEDAEIFAHNLFKTRKMSKREWQTYQSLYQSIVQKLRAPDLMIYLKGSLGCLRKRIRFRGRPEEQDINPRYLRRLNELYDDWFKRYDLSPTLVIETDHMDYATDLVDRLDLLATIESRVS